VLKKKTVMLSMAVFLATGYGGNFCEGWSFRMGLITDVVDLGNVGTSKKPTSFEKKPPIA
jgi:hypothetical protein